MRPAHEEIASSIASRHSRLSRIYTWRTQLVHGGATWQSSVNRGQVRDRGNLMGELVPLVIEIVLDHPPALWVDACRPVVE